MDIIRYTYVVRRDGPHQFLISKWDGGVVPVATYTITTNSNNTTTCSCPSGRYRGYCAHKDMVKSWVKAGEPEGLEFLK